MKKIIIVFLVIFAFSWISIASAVNSSDKRRNWPVQESPESIVTFAGGNGETISIISVPGTINLEQCTPWEDPSAPCIISLEDQGCKIVDVVVTHNAPFLTMTTYLLSCDGR